MGSEHHVRGLWKLNFAGREIIEDVTVSASLPDVWKSPSVTRGKGGQVLRRAYFPDANELTIQVTVPQESGDIGFFDSFLGVQGDFPVSFALVNDDHIGEGQKVGYYSPKAQVFGGDYSYDDDEGQTSYTIHCIGFRIDRKDAEAIISTDLRDAPNL